MRISEHSWMGRLGRQLLRLASPLNGAMAFVALVCLILIGHEVFHLSETRQRAFEDGRTDTQNLARSLGQHAADTFRAVEGVLIGDTERLETDARDEAGLERLHRLFRAQLASLPQLRILSAIDENGIVIVNSMPTTERFDLSAREYFQYHRANPDRSLHIGKPIVGRAKGEWVIPVSRRVDRADGSFAGVALATIGVDYFQSFYDTFGIGEHGAILLAAADGTLLVRRPYVEANIGKSLLDGVIFHDLLPKSPIATAELASSTDGVTRLNSYRRLTDYPLLVAVAEQTDELLAPWWALAQADLIRAAGLVAVVAVLGVVLARRTRALARQSALLHATLDNMDQGLIAMDETGHLSLHNRRALELLDLPAELMATRPRAADVVAYQESQGEFAGLAGEVKGHVAPRGVEDTYERKRPDGRTLEIRSVPFGDGGLVRTYTDVSARNLAEQELKESERLLRLLADNTTDIVARLGTDLRFAYVSPSSRDVLGRAPQSLVGRHAGEIVHPADRGEWAETLIHAKREAHEVTQATYRALRPDGSYLWVEENRRRLPADEGFVVSIRDIARRKAAEAQLETLNRRLEIQAKQDGLTGLANRRHFDELLETEFSRARREGTGLGLIMLDVDRFKRYNDLYGHPAGDECLRSVAAAVKGALLRPADLVARFGGEEFAVLLPATQAGGAEAVAERMRQAVRALELRHDANPTRIVTISLGVAWLAQGAEMRGADALLRLADGALYAAKAGGRDRVVLAGTPPAASAAAATS